MKDVKGYEGLYAVTSCGKVWSYYRNRFLKPHKHNCGYLSVELSKNGKRKVCLIHRLVAEAYIPNLAKLPQVNHKDENKFNNCLNNLEFSSALYNNHYGTHYKRVAASLSKAVHCIELAVDYTSIACAAKQLQINASNLGEAIRGNRKTAGGYHWRWAS